MSSHFTPIQKADLEWRDDLPFSPIFQDIYFSAESGIQQSEYVFINGNNLIQRWQELPDTAQSFNVGETGFGTGLNFLLTWNLWEQYAPPKALLHFISCEKHPLDTLDLKKSLSCWSKLEVQTEQLLKHYPVLTPGYHHMSFAQGRIRLTLMLGDVLDCFDQLLICGDSILESQLRTPTMDAWYLDGFNPQKNESMWSEALFKNIALLSKTGTTLATYTVAGSVKKKLKDAGFTLHKKKGFGPKRHMLTACLEQDCVNKIKTPHTPWHVGQSQSQQHKSALVLGAGLAGICTAYALAQKGWQVTVLEELDAPGQGGSANEQAVLFPKLSAYKSPLTHFMLLAFLHACEFYKPLLTHSELGKLCGIVLLAYNEKEKKLQNELASWLSHYPELGTLIDNERVLELTGLALKHSGLWIPQSGWINSPKLCNYLIQHPNIKLYTGVQIDALTYDDNQWVLKEHGAPVLILANGPKVQLFKETEHLPIKLIRGQMTTIASTTSSRSLLVPLCAEGHILPEWNNTHHLGATYDLGESQAILKPEDDKKNLLKLKKMSSYSLWSDDILGHWTGIRASTPDYLPLVGPAPQAEVFNKVYATLETNSKRWIHEAGPYYPGLYLCAAFGSRGLTSIPLCAEWLAASINNEISCLPRQLIQALSPARFLRRNIIRGRKIPL